MSFDPYHYALSRLHLRSTDDEVTHALHLAGAGQWDYARDHHFERYVFHQVITTDQLKAVLSMLNADRWAMEGGDKKFFCQKTWGLINKDWAEESKKYPNLTGAWYLASIRRIHCSCHQVGSFALNSRYTSTMHRIYRDERGDSIWYKGCRN